MQLKESLAQESGKTDQESEYESEAGILYEHD